MTNTGRVLPPIYSSLTGKGQAAMRTLCATCIVFALLFRKTSAFDLSDWINDAVSLIRNSEPATKVKNWAENLQRWANADWDCGADQFWFTKLASKAIARRMCPSVLDQINSACRWHDFCYSQGLEGQENCDARFCEALQAINFTTEQEKKACDLPRTMCNAVKLGGSLVYVDKTKLQ